MVPSWSLSVKYLDLRFDQSPTWLKQVEVTKIRFLTARNLLLSTHSCAARDTRKSTRVYHYAQITAGLCYSHLNHGGRQSL